MILLFTGIIQETGSLKNKIEKKNKYQLKIEASQVLNGITRGESIAVNGVCLTVVQFTGSSFTADVMPETVKKTNLQDLKKGARVNLEQPVKIDSFFGGHLVTGHIDDTGLIKNITQEKNAYLITINITDELEKYMVDKGSVAINGVSLTIMKVDKNSLKVSLIPETWKETNLQYVKPGDRVNIETDLIGKYVYKIIGDNQQTKDDSVLNKEFLKNKGFL